MIRLLDKLTSLVTLVLLLSTHVLHADTVTYIITDPAGSPIAGMNQAGAVTWRENYQPFGEKLENSSSSTDNDIWFAGKEFDDETGLSFFGARNYEPTIGRFVSIDPMGFDESNIQSFGRYAYGNNNPYKFVDPDGNLPVLVPIVVGIGLELINLGFEIFDTGANPCGDCVRSSSVSIPGGFGTSAIRASSKATTTVGRHMSPNELSKMKRTGRVQELGGRVT